MLQVQAAHQLRDFPLMLSKRIIPTILCRGRQMVKGTQFNPWRSVGLAAQAVRVHQMRSVDELVLLDVAATEEHRTPDLQLVSELADACFMPLTVGGGVRSTQDLQMLLRCGADKVVIGAEAYRNPRVLSACAAVAGRQAIVAAVDVHQDGSVRPNGDPMAIGIDALDLASTYARLGAGEILLTSVPREGTMQGYDLELIARVARAVPVPVIAHGGCGSYEHMRQAIEAGADAVAAGAFFQFTDATPLEAARYLQEHGIETRIPARAT